MTVSTEIKPRHLKTELEETLASARIVNIVGPRQAGKTTFVRDIFASERSGARFVTLDDQGCSKPSKTTRRARYALLWPI